MADNQPSKRLLQLAITDAVKTRLISKSAFKKELEKPRKLHLKCLTNKEDKAYQSMTNLLPLDMINLLKEIDKEKKQDYQCNSSWAKPCNDKHTMELNNEGTFNDKMGYSHLGQQQDFRCEDYKWNNTKLVANHACRNNLDCQYTENKSTNTTNLTSMHWDCDKNSYEGEFWDCDKNFCEGEFQDWDYMNSDFQISGSNYRARETYDANQNKSPNFCPESLLTNKDSIQIQQNCNGFVMPSVADQVPCMLKRKSGSTSSFSCMQTNDSINSPSLFLSSHEVNDVEPIENKGVSSDDFQNFKKCRDVAFRLGSNSNFQSIPYSSAINSALMMKESAAHSINNQILSTNLGATKQMDSPITMLNSDFNHISHIELANKHFQLNSEFVKKNEISDYNACSHVSQYSLTDFGKDNVPFSKTSKLEIFLNNNDDVHRPNSAVPKFSLSMHPSFNSNMEHNSNFENLTSKDTEFAAELDTNSSDSINMCSFESNEKRVFADEGRNTSKELNEISYSNEFIYQKTKHNPGGNFENPSKEQFSKYEIWPPTNYVDSGYYTSTDALSTSDSDVEISRGRDEVSRSNHFDTSVNLTDRFHKHKNLVINENNKRSFFEKHQENSFKPAFKCASQNSFFNFENDNVADTSFFMCNPESSVFEETNAYETFNHNIKSDEAKCSVNVSFPAKRLIDFDPNSKILPPMNFTEFPVKISRNMSCSKHEVETNLLKEMEKCHIFENDGCLNSDEMYLSEGLTNNNRENSEFLKKSHMLNENSDFSCLSKNERVSFEDSEVEEYTNRSSSYNTDYVFHNSLLNHESNILQHSKLDGFLESIEITKYVSSECESDYINNLINELM